MVLSVAVSAFGIAPVYAADSLAAGGKLTLGQYLESASAAYRFYLQGDGNLVIRNTQTQAAPWASGTNGKGGNRLVLQSDSNLVLYNSSNAAVWSSGTAGKGATQLKLYDNGALALLNGSNAVWSVNGTPPAATSYVLAVANGNGDGSYRAGQVVGITANAPALGSVFDKWVVNPGTAQIADVTKASTSLTMPAASVTVTATYKPAGSSNNTVLPEDTVLLRPVSNGPALGTITAYNWHSRSDWPDAKFELPIYKSMDRDGDDYWNSLVDELLLSRVTVVMLHGRGCTSLVSGNGGSGDLCPRVLSKFVAAVQRAGAQNVIKVGMWDDTGSYPNSAGVSRLDLSNRDNWAYFWDHNIKIWFDTLPKSMWYLMDGKPVIAEWSGADAFFSNQQGNMSAMLAWIKAQFKTRYGVEPAFILQKNWFENDSTITTAHAAGKHGWFTPKSDIQSSNHSYISYNGANWGATVPAFRDAGTLPGCGTSCREVTRRNGATLDSALAEGKNAKFILLEGWNDMAESAGYYRSSTWRYPAQYINIVRRYADPTPATLRFQAEGADAFYDKSSANLGGEYADRALDVGRLSDNSGWYVGWIEAGEWLEYKEVELGSGTYRFTVRAATNDVGKKMHLEIDGVPLRSIEMPNTGSLDSYQLAHLGEVSLGAGAHNLRLVFETTGGMNVDWFFLKRK